MLKKLKSEKGFTLLEAILSTILLSILAMGTTFVFREAAQSYFWYSSRADALQQARHGMTRMRNELSLLQQSEIVSISASDFGFTDSTNTEVHYVLGSYNGNTAILRGSDVLIPNASSLVFTYYDEDGTITGTVADVRQIAINMTVNADNNNGTVTLSTTVYPRSFMYTGFQ